MITVNFIRGEEIIPVQVDEGMTLMEAARDYSTNPIDEIPADQIKPYMDADVNDFPPIVISDGRLIDGQHRIQAARAKGINQLNAIDVTGLIDTDAGGYISELP